MHTDKDRWVQCRQQTLLLIHEVAKAEAEEADFELKGLGAGEELGEGLVDVLQGGVAAVEALRAGYGAEVGVARFEG